MLEKVCESERRSLVYRFKDGTEIRLLNLDEWEADRRHENPFITLRFFVRQLMNVAELARTLPPIANELHNFLIDDLRIEKKWGQVARSAYDLTIKTSRLTETRPFAEIDRILSLYFMIDYTVLDKESEVHRDHVISSYIDYLLSRSFTLRVIEDITMAFWHYMPDDRIFNIALNSVDFEVLSRLLSLKTPKSPELEIDQVPRKGPGRPRSSEKQRLTAMAIELNGLGHTWKEISETIHRETGIKKAPETFRSYAKEIRRKQN